MLNCSIKLLILGVKRAEAGSGYCSIVTEGANKSHDYKVQVGIMLARRRGDSEWWLPLRGSGAPLKCMHNMARCHID